MIFKFVLINSIMICSVLTTEAKTLLGPKRLVVKAKNLIPLRLLLKFLPLSNSDVVSNPYSVHYS